MFQRLASALTPVAVAAIALSFVGTTRAESPPQGLEPLAFRPLPLGQIKPAGWLEAQLKLQAQGLSGHLDEFWPDIKDSAWLGGGAEGWERVPYWLDGLVPLAYVLDDPVLVAKVKKAIDTILERQQPDGWLGPIGDNNPKHKPYDVWPIFPLFKALTQYYEATADPRVIPAMLRCARKIDEVISEEPLYSWSHYRAADLAVSLYWLHDRTREPWLLDLAKKVFAQAYDWRAHFESFDEKYTQKTTRFGLDNHGVNNAMAWKFGPVRGRLSAEFADRELLTLMLERLDRYHGQPTGMFTCDEHYAGLSPSQGTELCTVAEAMYSLYHAIATTADVRLVDRLEQIAYNALPATFKKDMTAHQYDQQCNQVICTRDGEHVYTNNGPDANLYGLEPHFGCCTANLHQAWPKFTSHLVMRSPEDDGLAVVAYAPCSVSTRVDGKPVKIDIKTEYPFRDVVFVRVTVHEPMNFPIHVRLPQWSEKAYLLFKNVHFWVDDEAFDAPEGGTLVTKPGGKFLVVEADWRDETTFVVEFRNHPRIVGGIDDSISILRGPLLFALPIEASWKKVVDRPYLPFDDWEVSPEGAWNFALAIARDNLGQSVQFEKTDLATGTPFRQDAPSLVARVKGRRLPSWAMEKSAAAPPPASPVTSDEALEDLTLVPYGCTDLRIAVFPWLK